MFCCSSALAHKEPTVNYKIGHHQYFLEMCLYLHLVLVSFYIMLCS